MRKVNTLFTDRDNEIVKHFEKYKYASIGQIMKIFLKEQECAYNIVRTRLGALRNADYIKSVKDIATNRNIYFLNEPKITAPSMHKMIVRDVYAELIYLGCKVHEFKCEKMWVDKKYFSDAFTVFRFEKGLYHFFIEVQLANHAHNLEKYDALYETGVVQKYLEKNHFPRIILISDREYPEITLNHTSVIQLNTKLDGFAKILLPTR